MMRYLKLNHRNHKNVNILRTKYFYFIFTSKKKKSVCIENYNLAKIVFWSSTPFLLLKAYKLNEVFKDSKLFANIQRFCHVIIEKKHATEK